jgi:hypothetical protein
LDLRRGNYPKNRSKLPQFTFARNYNLPHELERAVYVVETTSLLGVIPTATWLVLVPQKKDAEKVHFFTLLDNFRISLLHLFGTS